MAELNITMKQLNNQGQYDTLYPQTTGENIQGLTFDQVEGSLDAGRITGQIPANQVSYSNSQTSSIITSNQVQGAIDQLFTSVSNGKSLIAGAITDKGVSTSANDSFSQMASNIGSIQTGYQPTIANIEFIPCTAAPYSGGFTISFDQSYVANNYCYIFVGSVITEYGGGQDVFIYASIYYNNSWWTVNNDQGGLKFQQNNALSPPVLDALPDRSGVRLVTTSNNICNVSCRQSNLVGNILSVPYYFALRFDTSSIVWWS